jgi:hypothetical protein
MSWEAIGFPVRQTASLIFSSFCAQLQLAVYADGG